ncbi:MAG: hypothetical protein JWO38_7986 [Gemmataceae bacterium]|nr:hypothetical protein [Gemmataceae bacterium]
MTRTPPKTAAGRGVRRASGHAAWVETVGGFRDRSVPPHVLKGSIRTLWGLPNPAIPCHRPVTRSSPTARRSTTGPAQLALPGSCFCGSKPIDTVSSHTAGGPDQLGSRFCRPKPIDLDPSASAGQLLDRSGRPVLRTEAKSHRCDRVGAARPAADSSAPGRASDRRRPTSRPHAIEHPNGENPGCPDQKAITEGLSNPAKLCHRQAAREFGISRGCHTLPKSATSRAAPLPGLGGTIGGGRDLLPPDRSPNGGRKTAPGTAKSCHTGHSFPAGNPPAYHARRLNPDRLPKPRRLGIISATTRFAGCPPSCSPIR